MEEDESNLPPMTAQDYSEANDWSGYFRAVLGKGARETLVAALDRFAGEGVNIGLKVDTFIGFELDTFAGLVGVSLSPPRC